MRNPYLCIVIVGILGCGGLLGIAGIIGLAANAKAIPESLIAVVSCAFGALASFLVAPPRGSVGAGNSPDLPR
jgi:hypothetical protein